MRTLVANEFRKLRTARWPWVVLLAQQLLIVLGISGIVASGEDLRAPIADRLVLCHAGLSSLLVLVMGIMAVAGEYRDGTITDTFLATPRRSRVIGAKLIAYTALGLVSGLISAATAFTAAWFWFNAKGVSLDPASQDVWRTLLGVAVWMPPSASGWGRSSAAWPEPLRWPWPGSLSWKGS